MEYEMSKQLFDACASSGTECNSEWKKGCREQPADFSKLTNHNCKTCDPPPATTSLSAGAFFLRFIRGSVFHALEILKLDQVQIYDRREQQRDFFFFPKNWSDSASSCDQCTFEWHQIEKLPAYFWRKQILAF